MSQDMPLFGRQNFISLCYVISQSLTPYKKIVFDIFVTSQLMLLNQYLKIKKKSY